MAERLFPPLQTWFEERFEGRSEIQKRALPHTLRGENTLILAPTGSGKTLAAFLSILSALGKRAAGEGLPNAVCAVYVSPLRSLTRDIERNLSGPLEALNAALPEPRRIRMDVRTGDTSDAIRSRMQRRRPHLLLTTPESLSSLLSQTGWRDGFEPFVAVVDEIHAMAESKRGTLLALSLERLEERAGRALQRIGLSATAHPVEEVRRLLCGARECAVAESDIRKTHRLEIAELAPESRLPAAGWGPFPIAHTVARLIQEANCSLVFTATRSGAERLALALRVLLPDWEEQIGVHHASIAREERLRIEEALASGSIRAAVCSTSLELGVDFSAVDQVVLIGAPRGVSRAIQRLGRSGHRVGGVASGLLVPLSLPDLLECIAVREAVRAGRLDELKIVRQPLDVLAQVVLGMAVEREWGLDEAFALVRRAGPYVDLPRADFDSVVEYLAGGGPVLSNCEEAYGKITVRDGRFRVASTKVARQYYQNIGTISDAFLMRVYTRHNRRLGEVEEEFITTLQPKEAFIIGGKAVRVERMHADVAVVAPAEGENVRTPRWMGGKMSLSARLACEELALRRALRGAYARGGMRACRGVLKSGYGLNRSAVREAAAFLEHQVQAAPIPVDTPVQVERIAAGRSLLILFHVLAGRAVNRSLAWVAGHRLGKEAGSVAANFDDHGFLLALNARSAPGPERLRELFDPERWCDDLLRALRSTEQLGRKFRPVAETGQLLARRTVQGPPGRRQASWSGSLLYETFLKHQPDHPLVRETVRATLEEELDAARAAEEAARIHAAPWEFFDLPRPSPLALPLFAAFNREVLIQQDPEKAVDEWVTNLYEAWSAGAGE
jgi:ATP-dependent helicase Lhr and Lhr-like helicase